MPTEPSELDRFAGNVGEKDDPLPAQRGDSALGVYDTEEANEYGQGYEDSNENNFLGVNWGEDAFGPYMNEGNENNQPGY